ncbi:septum formation initiator family protein [Methylocella sp. CPCC 101449]|uniref:FtsB family cell division protein n=1 Tax=Methylocella sp. CPCC 101449 TaxID=2987531 RepID=UPI00288F8D2E|nr:septum formation initiator family protein [Methylocella sp. CPCC 101449]MDT2022031.1 septum formation initiator family protein [Methylocella sp. CPCC 101449]HEV2572139.1 septum formation initiator family protein [Beijerinckiaceae bacterium]
MVIRRRLRSVLLPLLLYVVSGSVSSYFIWHAVNGERGLKTKEEYRKVMADLIMENAGLRGEREQIERRISMMRAEAVERDILEEEARVQLGRVHKNDVVVFLKPDAK